METILGDSWRHVRMIWCNVLCFIYFFYRLLFCWKDAIEYRETIKRDNKT